MRSQTSNWIISFLIALAGCFSTVPAGAEWKIVRSNASTESPAEQPAALQQASAPALGSDRAVSATAPVSLQAGSPTGQLHAEAEAEQIGPFDTYYDAWAAVGVEVQTEVAKVVRVSPGETVSLVAPEPQKSFEIGELGTAAATIAPADIFPDTSATALTPSLLAKTPNAMTRNELLAVGMRATENANGVPALEEALLRLPNDPDANKVRVRLARRLLGRKEFTRVLALSDEVIEHGSPEEKAQAKLVKSYAILRRNGVAAAREHFRAVANDPNSSEAIRRDAMRRTAGAAHAAKDYADAWKAFRQIEANAASDVEKGEARMQLAGLAFEMTKDGKGGDWDEIRALCSLAAQTPGASRKNVATSKLMSLETYMEERRSDEAIAAVDSFVAEFQDIPREHAAALIVKGVALGRKGDMAGCRTVLEQVMNMDLTGAERFAKVDLNAKAALWLAFLARQNGDAQLAEQVTSRIRNQWPKAPETKELPSLFPELQVSLGS